MESGQFSTYRTVVSACELIEHEPQPVPEVQFDCVDSLRYVVLYSSEGQTHCLGVLRSEDSSTLFFRNRKFSMLYVDFKNMCLNAADTATLVYFMFQPTVVERMYDLSPLLNMTCV